MLVGIFPHLSLKPQLPSDDVNDNDADGDDDDDGDVDDDDGMLMAMI